MKARARIGTWTGAGAAATVAIVMVAPLAAFAGTASEASGGATLKAAQSVKAAKTAKISARGAAVRIPLSYTCPAGWEGSLSIQLVQALGDHFASGYAGKPVKCTGKARTVNVYLQANAYQGARPFSPGPASAAASLDTYDPAADPCADQPCTFSAEPMAEPPAGASVLSAVTEPGGPAMSMPPSNEHSEFHGTIGLVG